MRSHALRLALRPHAARPLGPLASQRLLRLRTLSSASPSDPPITTTTFPAPHTGLIKLLLLSRPAGKNSISVELLSQLRAALAPIATGEDKLTRALIIASAVPGVFCAGADLKERKSMTQAQVDSFLGDLRACLKTLEGLPIPTISAISGFALGGGLELALATDLRVVGGLAQLGLPETRLGIIPGAGGTYRLPKLVGQSRARDIVFTGRRVGALEAVTIGLANRIVEVGEELDGGEGRERVIDAAIELAQGICLGGPVAIRMAKQAVKAEDEEAENMAYLNVVGTEDRNEALRAFQEKRKPVFKGM